MKKTKQQAAELTVNREAVANLSIAEAVELLKTNGCENITVAEMERQIASGAPTNPDGSIDLVHYAAWLCCCGECE